MPQPQNTDPNEGLSPEEIAKKQQEDEEALKLAKANKEEDNRLEKLKKELAEKRKERKELQRELHGDNPVGDDPETDAPATPAADDLDKKLDAKMKEREKNERNARLVMIIKKTAKNKQEAEAIYSQLSKFESTGDDALDVKFAIDRATAIREKGGFSSPSFSDADFSGGGNDAENDLGVSEGSKEWLNQNGIKDDDIKKFKDGMDLTRVFPKVIENPLKAINN